MNIPRSSGILLHVTSLPGKYGIGDLGAEARRFVDFLSDAGQRYWQVLPLNPTRMSGGNSPYGSPSAFAGNPLLVSPRRLYDMKLIGRKTLKSGKGFSRDRVQFQAVTEYKHRVLHEAFHRFQNPKKQKRFAELREDYEAFCAAQADWLDDYALFAVLSDRFGKPWMEWPHPLRDRVPEALEDAQSSYREDIECIKFSQFLFFRQWHELVDYARQKNVHMFGDLPFYVAGDSADAWSNVRFFKIAADKQPTAVSGVPPDAFSEDGQLWGTPVYDWGAMEEDGFSWWLARLRHNLELFDLLRIDHFRAFSAYWEVPPHDDTAIDGKWVDVPGDSFFETVRQAMPDLPFVAEDLGDIDQPVYDLRDRFELPGMNVLEYAFGDDASNSFLPHNHRPNSVVYVGTHDNPTAVEWISKLPKEERKALTAYLGRRVRKSEVGQVMARMALSSVARLAVLQMQDLLGLGAKATMNRPGTTQDNWLWRMKSHSKLAKIGGELAEWIRIYGRR